MVTIRIRSLLKIRKMAFGDVRVLGHPMDVNHNLNRRGKIAAIAVHVDLCHWDRLMRTNTTRTYDRG